LNVPVRKLSLGERMKCEIAASLLHSPEVLFLDEPTIGLDVISQVRIREFLKDYNQRTGITVLLTSHYMADIEALCERVIVMNEGRVIFDGALKQLLESAANKRAIKLRLEREVSPEEYQSLNDDESDLTCDGFSLNIAVPRDQVASRVEYLLKVLPVEDLTVEDVEIEAVIRELFSRGQSADC
jgi:ABC-2 type transport system ATP-binding protein